MTKEQKLINFAHEWIGTRFKHQGRIKISENSAGGCDCLGLILGLDIYSKDGKNLKEYDLPNYPRLLKSNILQEQLDKLLPKIDKIEKGAILLIKINNWPEHLALVVETEPCVIIHSYAQARKVVKQHLPEKWKKNISAIYKSIS
jgi:hypothetical protein